MGSCVHTNSVKMCVRGGQGSPQGSDQQCGAQETPGIYPPRTLDVLGVSRLLCYIQPMTDTLTLSAVMPSAMPSEAEISAWQEFPRDEQVRRLRQVLTSPEASKPSGSTMAEIWAEIDSDEPVHG